MLLGELKDLGFEFENCSAMYELDLNIEMNKYKCKACDLEFCPVKKIFQFWFIIKIFFSLYYRNVKM